MGIGASRDQRKLVDLTSSRIFSTVMSISYAIATLNTHYICVTNYSIIQKPTRPLRNLIVASMAHRADRAHNKTGARTCFRSMKQGKTKL